MTNIWKNNDGREFRVLDAFTRKGKAFFRDEEGCVGHIRVGHYAFTYALNDFDVLWAAPIYPDDGGLPIDHPGYCRDRRYQLGTVLKRLMPSHPYFDGIAADIKAEGEALKALGF